MSETDKQPLIQDKFWSADSERLEPDSFIKEMKGSDMDDDSDDDIEE